MRVRGAAMAVAGLALAALAVGCASVQQLAAEERWYDACRRADAPAEEAAFAAALVERLDASFAVDALDAEQVRAALGDEGVAFAAARPIVAIRVQSRAFDERRAYDEHRSARVTVAAVTAGGTRRSLRARWDPPEPPRSSPARTPWGDFSRAMGTLLANVLVGPLEVVTGGAVETGVRPLVEGAAEGVADAIETVDSAAAAFTAPAADGPPPPAAFPEAINRLLEDTRCEEAEGRRTCYWLRFLDEEGTPENGPDRMEIILEFHESGSRDWCRLGRRATFPLPPGATLAERIDAAFASGPRRLADLEIRPF